MSRRYELDLCRITACIMVIIRIKYLNNILCKVLLLDSLLVITLIERVKVKRINRLCVPDSKRVNSIIAISKNRNIIWNSDYRTVIFLNEHISSSLLISVRTYISTKFNFISVFRSLNFKWIAIL